MKSKGTVFVVLVAAFVGSFINPSEAYTAEFHSSAYGYRIELPPGWVEIPSDVLQESMSAVYKNDKAAAKVVYEAAFQLDSASHWLEYPYVLVQPIPYARFGLHRQLTDAEMPEFVRTLTGLDIKKAVDEAAAPDVLTNLNVGKPELDAGGRRYFWETTMDVAGVGPVRGLIVGHFGREAIIQVAFYTRHGDWDRYRAARGAFVGGFQFDPAKSYRVAGDAAASIRDMQEGHRVTFSTKGHTKAKGVHFTVAYPESWVAAEGERPNIVQKFVSDGRRGMESMIIQVVDLPLPPETVLTEQEQIEALSEPTLRELVFGVDSAGPPGGALIKSEATRIEGVPAAIIEYTMRHERVGITAVMHAWTLVFISDNKLVLVQFDVAGPAESEADLSRRMEEFKPLFQIMANSIVFPDKWISSASAAPASGNTRIRFNGAPKSVWVALFEGYGQTFLMILGATIIIAVGKAVLFKRKTPSRGNGSD